MGLEEALEVLSSLLKSPELDIRLAAAEMILKYSSGADLHD